MLLARQEYVDAVETFEKDQRPVMLIGQPGVGKTLFLLYALIKRLIKGRSTIYSTDPRSCYLFRESGAYQFTSEDMTPRDLRSAMREIHGRNVPGGDFGAVDEGWILFELNESQESLTWNSAKFLRWKTVISSSPKLSRYKEWVKQKNAMKYVMKPWSWSEICAGAY
ncbi:hypothetical protein BKA93DRAFT_731796, partial [Sparassis latifolia]